MQLFNKGEAKIIGSKHIAPKQYVEIDDAEGEKLLKMYPYQLVKTPSAVNVEKLEAENAELKKQLQEVQNQDEPEAKRAYRKKSTVKNKK